MKNSKKYKQGSLSEFDLNWKKRPESLYNHWSPSFANNQIRLAFQSHFKLFKSLEKTKSNNKSFIELGAGRGSLSAYYSQAGYDVTLLDTSEEILNKAKLIFNNFNLKANYIVANAEKTELSSDQYDIVASIGLLEHFKDPVPLFNEAIRLANKNAEIIFYVVPDRVPPIQNIFDYLNSILSFFKGFKPVSPKEDVYRNDYVSSYYIRILKELNGINDIKSFGVYPLPMISPSRDFPFTLNNKLLEFIITNIFRLILYIRAISLSRNPWICKEKNGQAFVLHFRKS